MDSRETCESLGKLSQTVQWVDVWRFSVASDGVTVKTDALDGLWCSALLSDVVVGGVKCHGVTNEVASGGLQAELIKDILHGAGLNVQSLVACGVALVEGSDPLNEGLHSPLLEYAHKGRCESLSGIRWHLCNGSLAASSLLHEGSSNLLELAGCGNVGGEENVAQLSAGHEELGDQVNVPVVGATVLLPRLLSFWIVSELLEELRCVRYGLSS